MVDVSFDDIEEMNKLKYKLIWIDHHISAIRKHDPEILGLRDTNFAACELTWKYFFPDEPIPWLITQLGKYDTWRKDDKWDTVVMPVQTALKAYCNSPETFPSWGFDGSNSKFNELIENGKLMLASVRNTDVIKCRSSFVREIDGHRALCLNAGAGSGVYRSVYDPEKHDIMCSFIFNGKSWTVSFYSEKDIDCSQIAIKRGGGGHKGAAGCTMTTNQLIELLRLP